MSRASRRSRAAAPEPATPPVWLKRDGTDFPGLERENVICLLEKIEGTKQQKPRRTRAGSYLEILKSEDPDARSCDGLSKQEIEDKLELCVEAYWETYDEAMNKFRAQNVEAPAPAAVELPVETLETYKGLSLEQREELIVKRQSKAWATSQERSYTHTIASMNELLRDQAVAVPSVVIAHPAPAPKYAVETAPSGSIKSYLDADTLTKWLRELQTGTAIVAFKKPEKEASTAILLTLPTLKHAANATQFRGALVKLLERPATANDVKEAFLDAADELGEAWGDYKMVPDGLTVTVEDLRCRLGELEAPEVSAAQLRGEPAVLSAERRKELECNSMYYACGLVCRNWGRDLALALREDVEDYAKKAAQLKHDRQNYFHWIRNVTAAVAARLRAERRRDWNSSNRGERHDNVPKVRDARVGAWKRFATPRGGAFNYKPSVKPQG